MNVIPEFYFGRKTAPEKKVESIGRLFHSPKVESALHYETDENGRPLDDDELIEVLQDALIDIYIILTDLRIDE